MRKCVVIRHTKNRAILSQTSLYFNFNVPEMLTDSVGTVLLKQYVNQSFYSAMQQPFLHTISDISVIACAATHQIFHTCN